MRGINVHFRAVRAQLSGYCRLTGKGSNYQRVGAGIVQRAVECSRCVYLCPCLKLATLRRQHSQHAAGKPKSEANFGAVRRLRPAIRSSEYVDFGFMRTDILGALSTGGLCVVSSKSDNIVFLPERR